MTPQLINWVKENKLTISKLSSDGDLDIVSIEDVGNFLYIKPTENKIIDEEFAFILSDEEFACLDERKADYILFEFGGKFYYSELKQGKNKYNEIVYFPSFNDFKYIGKCSEKNTSNYANIGVHDEYELLSGSGSCELWCKKAKFLGHKAIGVCNENSLASIQSFSTYAQKYGLKCIIGETIKVARNYDAKEEIQELYELKLYVLNEVGYHNLLMISKTINVDYDGFIPSEILYQYGEGICCVVAKNSEINYLMRQGKIKEARNIIDIYKKSFDKTYYQIDTVEYTSAQLFREHLQNIDNYIINFAKILEPIMINDSYYLDAEEWELKNYLSKVAGKAVAESQNQHFKSFKEAAESYKEWIDNNNMLTAVIAASVVNLSKFIEGISWKLDISERKLPKFEVKNPEETFFDVLQKGIEEKLVGKVKDIDKYMERIKIECELIVPNDLCSYFLILWDICNWCKENNIMVGPGRGSVCGSLVAYCLNITQIDPIPYQLYFERFLNPTRVEKQFKYEIVFENGKKHTFQRYDKIPLTNGETIVADNDTDWENLDVDVDKL